MGRDKIFINYRRDDSRADSGRLYDRLAGRFPGAVFRDVASLAPGVEWGEAINRVLTQTDVCIVVIGRSWATITDASGRRRLDDPSDTVRQEIATALNRKMRMFPVLVGGAKMPGQEELPAEIQALARHHAIELSEQDWDEDYVKLLRAIETSLGVRPTEPVAAKRPSRWKWALIGALGAVILLAVYSRQPQPQPEHGRQQGPGTGKSTDAPSGGAVPAQPVAGVTVPPVRPAPRPVNAIGNWHVVAGAGGQAFEGTVEIYGDHSFRGLVGGISTSVGSWADSGGGLLESRGTILINGMKFRCEWRNTGDDQFGGSCIDLGGVRQDMTLTRESDSPPNSNYNVPRVDLSVLKEGERAAFVQRLAALRCTCACGMTLVACLERDLRCQYSPRLAANQLAMFLRLVRG